jgi:hypothetical protein
VTFGNFKQGKYHGRLFSFNEKGDRMDFSYKDDMRDGRWTTVYADGY